MAGVLATLRIVMGHGVWERSIPAAAAVGTLVNVKPENSFLAGLVGLRKSTDFGIDDHPFVYLVKTHPAGYAGKATAAGYAGLGLRSAAQHGKKVGIGQIHVQDSFTEILYMASYADWGHGVRKICPKSGNAIKLSAPKDPRYRAGR